MTLPTVSTALTRTGVITEAKFLKQNVASAITALAAGNVSANAIISLCQRLNTSKANVLVPAQASNVVLTNLAADLGLVDAAAANTAIQGVVDAITNSIAWVVANFPNSTVGGVIYILKDTLNADGSVTVRVFTPAQTAGFRTVLQTIVNAIS